MFLKNLEESVTSMRAPSETPRPLVPYIRPYLGQNKLHRALTFVTARDISYLTMDTLCKDITCEMRPKSPDQCLTSVRFVTQNTRLWLPDGACTRLALPSLVQSFLRYTTTDTNSKQHKTNQCTWHTRHAFQQDPTYLSILLGLHHHSPR